MAKKQADPVATKAAAVDERVMICQIKGTAEFRDWLNRLADSQRLSAVQFLERAAMNEAARIGFAEPAPKRL